MVDQFGNYIVEEPLNDGGIGRIYRGRHQLLERRVAIKALHERYAGDPQFRERFLREARAMAALDHPNIVRIFDFGEQDGRFYLVMELVEGGSVRAMLDEAGGRVTDLRLTVELARQAAAGLAYAHDLGMVHRDIKPANLLLDFSGGADVYGGRVLKISDFGLVRLADTATVTAAGTTLGTAAYMSPEQCAGGEIDRRSDIYSLGVVLFEMLTGQMPFGGTTAAEIAEKHVHERPPAPQDLVPELPDALNAITLRCLAKSPLSRYQSCADLLDDLVALAVADSEPTRELEQVGTPTAPVAPRQPPASADTVPAASVAGEAGRPDEAAEPASATLQMTIEPAEASGRVLGRYGVHIDARAGSTARLTLAVDTPGGRLWTRLKPATLVVTPDAAARADLTVLAWPRFGRDTARHPLRVRAESVRGPQGSAVAGFNQPPLAYGWMPFAAGGALVAVLACLLIGATLTALTGARPFGIGAEAGDHGIWVVDGDGRTQRIDASGELLGGLDAPDDVETITGLALDNAGNLYLTDGEGARVVKLSEEGELLAEWGETGGAPGQFIAPSDIAIGRDGSVYVVDTGNNRIQVFDPDGGFLAQYGEQGSAPGQFDNPSALAFDRVGNFYVVDTGSNRVQKLQSFGAFLLAWGEAGDEPGQFNQPLGVALDADGNVYIADAGNGRIQKFDFDGRLLAAWGAGGEGTPSLERPVALAVLDERLYAADEANGRVLVYSLAGDFEGYWPADGVEDAQFDGPRVLAVEP